MLEPKAPPARNGPNTGSLAPGVRRRVKKKGFVNLKINVADELSLGLFLLNRVMVYLLSTIII